MVEEVLEFWLERTRARGYPPFPLEVGVQFGLETGEAVALCKEVQRRLAQNTVDVEFPRQDRPEVVNARMKPLSPPPAGRVDLRPFTGRNGWPDERSRQMYWHSCYKNVYARGSVDYMLHDEQVALTPETEGWFYGAEAAEAPRYRRGSRPFLERVVEETARGCETDRARAMALVRLIGNPETNPYRCRGGDWARFLGGTEEEIIRKAWRMCNEISRALTILCHVAGLPARGMFFFTDPLNHVHGHSMTEIFFDGKWNLIEQNAGIMFLKADGYFASAVELRDRPEIINARTDLGVGPSRCHAAFTGPVSILPYRVDRVDHYQYTWQEMKYHDYPI